MAAEIEEIQYGAPTELRFKSTAIAVAAATDTTIATFEVPAGATHLFFEVKNTGGGAAFDTFIITRRAHPDGDWETIADAAGDFTTPQSPIIEASGSPVTLADGVDEFVRMEVEGMRTIRLQASGNAATTTAEVYAFIR